MTTFNTGNPLGSTDVYDRYDNSENLDNFSNGPLDAYPDRFGVPRQSLQGIRNASQYQVIGAYAAGLQITAMNQVFSYLGEFYAPGPSITLPYTTTGVGAAEIANFRSVGDAVLRADLLDPIKGSDIIAYRVGATVQDALDRLQGIAQYTPEQFGAVGDGVANDTVAMQAAADAAAANSGVFAGVPGSTYYFTTVMIKNGTRGVTFLQSVLLPSGTLDPTALTAVAPLVLQGALTGGSAVIGCLVSVTMDMSNGDRIAILGDGSQYCEFAGNVIYGFTNHATYNHRGIRVQEGGSYNSFHHNSITGFKLPTKRGLLLDLWGALTGLPDFGGFFSGTISRAATPAVRNLIYDNRFIDGSYAMNIHGCERTIISNNICHNQNHRSMWVGNSSFFNLIQGNNCSQFSSSAILLGYGCQYNIVDGNVCINEPGYGVGGESVININTGSSYNLIKGNICDAPVNYSVYVATDSSYNLIQGNTSRNAYVAAFAAENDWIDTLPANNFFGRPNYEDPFATTGYAGATSWTYTGLKGTVFQDNVVHSGYAGRSIAAFYIGQILNTLVGATPTTNTEVTLKGNTVLTGTNIGYGLYLYEQIAAQLSKVSLIGNTFSDSLLATANDFAAANTSSAALNPKDVGLIYARNNGAKLDELIYGSPITFASLDTSPSVKYWTNFTFANASATSVTTFDDGVNGQEIIVRGDANTTIVYNASFIRTKGSVNITGMTTNSLVAFRRISGIWLEMWRNF